MNKVSEELEEKSSSITTIGPQAKQSVEKKSISAASYASSWTGRHEQVVDVTLRDKNMR